MTVGRLLTAREVSLVLRVSQTTLYRMIQRGEIPAVRIGGGRVYRFRYEDVERFITGAA